MLAGLAAFALVVIGVSFGSTGAAADPTFSIRGTISNTSGVGIPSFDVYLYDTSNSAFGGTTTAADGSYVFSGRAPDTYLVKTSASAEYVTVQSAPVTVSTGDVNGVDLTVTRYGVLSGTVTNYTGLPDSSVQVSVSRWDGTSWNPAGFQGFVPYVASNGTYSVPAVDVTGEYRISFIVGDTSLPLFTTYYGDSYDSPDPSSTSNSGIINGIAETDISGLDVTLIRAGHITGTVSSGGTPLSGQYVEAFDNAGNEFDADSPTDVDGSYSIKVPAGDAMQVGDDDIGTYYPQYYNGHNLTPTDFDPVTVTAGDTRSGVNFDLIPVSGSVLLALDVENNPAPAQPAENVTAHLYVLDDAGNVLESISTPVQGGLGLLLAFTAGNYVIEFTNSSGARVAIDSVTEGGNPPQSDPYFESGSCSAYMGTVQQFQVDGGSSAFFDFVLDPDLSICNAAPSTPTPPKHHHAFVVAGSIAAAAATPTPTPTPTPTETPSASPSPSPSASSTPAPVVASSTGGLPWWIWLLIVVGILILAGIGFVLFRRR